MSGSTLRRTVLCLLVVTLLLPLASAWAVPAKRTGTSPSIQMPDWSRILLQPVDALLSLFRPVAEASSMPPGQHPGNEEPRSSNRDGNGFDPHGRP
jgi:hypothetical protein